MPRKNRPTSSLSAVLDSISDVFSASVAPSAPAAPHPQAAPPAPRRDEWSLELLKAIDQKRFEFLCAAYFETLGFRPELSLKDPGGCVDIRLYSASELRPGILAQCRAWSTHPAGMMEVRELVAVMTFERVEEGALVVAGTFSKDARDYAQARNVLLIDGADLLGKINGLDRAKREDLLAYTTEADSATPACASCGMKMVRMQRKSDDQPYWDCVRHPLRKVAAHR